MNDYIANRKEYIKQIRASFEEPQKEFDIDTTENITNIQSEPNITLKSRCFLAIFIFICIFFCHYNSYSIFGIEVSEIIDRISDNRYYIFLENCDILEDDNYSELIYNIFDSNIGK